MQYIKIAKTSDFANRKYKSFSLLGKKIGVFREGNGGFYAMEVHCKHQNADLLASRPTGDIVTCNRHGWQFNLKTGACLTPGQEWAKLRRFPLKIEGEAIFVCPTPLEEDATP